MKIRNHMEMITKSIECIRVGAPVRGFADLTFNISERTFLVCALQSLASINDYKSVDRVSRGKTVSPMWAFYPFFERDICKLNTNSLQLRAPFARAIRESKVLEILGILETIEHEIDLDATIRNSADYNIINWNVSVLKEKSCAIKALKNSVAFETEATQND